MTLVVRHGQGSSSSRSNSSTRKPLHCSYCYRDHHVRETCWKLNEYPPEHPKHASNKSNQGSSYFKRNHSHQSSTNNVKEGPVILDVLLVTHGLFDLQLQQILSLIQGKGTTQLANPKANAATASSGLSQALLRLHQLVIDSGAIDHITSSPTLLVNRRKNTLLPPVAMPSGEHAPITSIGNLPLSSTITLKNVLGVPSFKVDLMSVSRITRDLHCSVTFFPYWCILQDLRMKKTIGLGKQRDRLYLLVALASKKSKHQPPSAATTSCRLPNS